MIVCDMCKQDKAIPILQVGELNYTWCGKAECRIKLMTEINAILEASEHKIKASLYEPPVKEK